MTENQFFYRLARLKRKWEVGGKGHPIRENLPYLCSRWDGWREHWGCCYPYWIR